MHLVGASRRGKQQQRAKYQNARGLQNVPDAPSRTRRGTAFFFEPHASRGWLLLNLWNVSITKLRGQADSDIVAVNKSTMSLHRHRHRPVVADGGGSALPLSFPKHTAV